MTPTCGRVLTCTGWVPFRKLAVNSVWSEWSWQRLFELLFITQRSARRSERECWAGAVFGVPQGTIIGLVWSRPTLLQVGLSAAREGWGDVRTSSFKLYSKHGTRNAPAASWAATLSLCVRFRGFVQKRSADSWQVEAGTFDEPNEARANIEWLCLASTSLMV